MQGLQIKLILCLLTNTTQIGAQRRFGDCLRIGGIVLLSLHERLHVDRRDEPN